MQEGKSAYAQIHKKLFVSTLLEPLLKGIDREILSARYFKLPIGEEIVEVRFNNGFVKTVCVTADSLKAIAVDVLKEI